MTPKSGTRRRTAQRRGTGTFLAAGAIATAVLVGSATAPATADPPPAPILRYGVVAWGFNDAGQLGDNTTVTRPSPVTTNAPAGAMKQVSAGDRFGLALDSYGRVWSWGENTYGQLGDSTTVSRTYAALVPGLTDVTQISAGEGFALAIDGQSQVWSWGANHHGQLGDGTTINRSTPGRVSVLPGAHQVAAGGMHALALVNREVYAWGDNSTGQLGDGTRIPHWAPVRVQGLEAATYVSAGRFSNVVVEESTWIYSWGSNSHGQLGDGSYQDRLVPQSLGGAGGQVRHVAVSGTHTVLLRWDGVVFAWGNNAQGQLGDGTYVNRPRPVTTIGVPGTVVEIAAGGSISMSRRSDGRVYQWGRRPNPAFPNEMYAVPSAFPGISGAIAIDAGGDSGGPFCLAVKNVLPVFEPLGERSLRP
jgi:alpha-tubulin suppressor-like RCC1 family protein